MSADCKEAHADWIGVALADGLDAVPQEERRALQECPMCSADLEELGALQTLVQGAASAESEDLARAAREAGAEEEALVRELHRRNIEQAGRSPSTLRRVLPIVTGLAAVLVLAASLWFLLDADEVSVGGEDPFVLLSSDHPLAGEPLEPLGTSVASFATMRWKAGDTAVSSWDVEVLDLEGNPLDQRRRVHGESLEFAPEDAAAWPDTIEWTLTPRDAGGQLLPQASVLVRASRSSD